MLSSLGIEYNLVFAKSRQMGFRFGLFEFIFGLQLDWDGELNLIRNMNLN